MSLIQWTVEERADTDVKMTPPALVVTNAIVSMRNRGLLQLASGLNPSVSSSWAASRASAINLRWNPRSNSIVLRMSVNDPISFCLAKSGELIMRRILLSETNALVKLVERSNEISVEATHLRVFWDKEWQWRRSAGSSVQVVDTIDSVVAIFHAPATQL